MWVFIIWILKYNFSMDETTNVKERARTGMGNLHDA